MFYIKLQNYCDIAAKHSFDNIFYTEFYFIILRPYWE